MGRELRRVPENWLHPKDEQVSYIPLLTEFSYSDDEVEEGLRDGWLTGDPPNYGCGVMPQWAESQKTHFQMYEDTSEGTPISPVMPSIELLAKWLADTGASAFGGMSATYEQWLATCKSGYAVSAVFSPGRGIISGVEFEAENKNG